MRPPITELAITASKFRSAIVLETEKQMIDVRSVMGLYSVYLKENPYIIHVSGDDEVEARAALQEVIKNLNLQITVK